MGLPPTRKWFDPRITTGTILTLASMLYGGYAVMERQTLHTASIEATEALHNAQITARLDASERALKLADQQRKEALDRMNQLQREEREDVRAIRETLEGFQRRRGGMLDAFPPKEFPG